MWIILVILLLIVLILLDLDRRTTTKRTATLSHIQEKRQERRIEATDQHGNLF